MDLLAKTEMFQASDGKDYVCIALTNATPTEENIKQLHEILDYIPTLNKRFVIIVDTREANAWSYMKFIPDFLKRLNLSCGACVVKAEVWVSSGIASLILPLVQPLIDTILRSDKISLKTI
jgi:hypothetical protein